MFIKLISLALMLVMMTGTSLAFAAGSNDKKAAKREAKLKKHGGKIKKGIEKLGVSKDSIVRVRFRDKSEIMGYISAIDENSFSVTDESKTVHVVEYPNAKQVKGNNLSKGAWIAIGFGLAMAVFGIAILYAISKN